MKKTIMSLAAAAAMSATAFGATASAKEIEVQKGDTLWGISQNYGMNLKDLKKWNQLSSDLIFPGQKLNISSQEEKSEEKQYTVQPGDTLSKIAKEFGVTVSDLQKRNNLKSDLIIAGQTIAINGEAAAAAAPVKQESAPKQNDQPVNVQKEITVTATAYTANDGGISGITKTGVDLNANRNAKVIAVDPSVIPLGTKVYVEGYGEATAEDTGGAIKGHKIDVFIPDKKDAFNWGVKTVKVKILN
ncbi:LysM peptidoglycan-binding domain-containing protein [Bacillus licheniformis]|jgi:3D (Asp-Asp-Asp) domain-containing protein|uniref:Peptidoglycan-binding protein n=2 Tax=Bacillus licheniformis TaxID=1402 RepID=Q65L51_BACLD|nr:MULTISPECIES: 3D domain-containing protein [Bacillus]MBJ7887781.1 LysM peptidoglycan-binding domain-containing protein [Bacillaceae bacterium HSR45]MBY8349789.1 LysM peptidoglycan-binding domain-containing protein [Bacillus sp. PCH94]MDP4082447.1 LysM peptidoglycan-binding domain-containing protein [Bacillota bacterium]AAU22864.1 Peptidoglycan-binding protein [Bacillus licheniformis DSM 13 = ATCC 14580]AAU40213.1 putative peptidoglycan hydrolase YocH [Bacillus licheniformis DSM 13 = ATCC 14